MKKTLTLLGFMIILLFVPPFCAEAYDAPNLLEDFESYEVGDFVVNSDWNMEEKADTGGDIQVVQESNNKMGRISVTYTTSTTVDSFIETPLHKIDQFTVIGGSIRNATIENGDMTIGLRDGVNPVSVGIINLIQLTRDGGNKVVKYFPSLINVSEVITNDTWINFSVTLDPETYTLKLYRDGVLKATVDNFKTAKSGHYAAYDLECVKLRVSASALRNSTVVTYVDNISFFSDQSLRQDLVCLPAKMSVGIQNVYYPIKSIRKGNSRLTTTMKNMGMTEKSTVMMVAYMKGNVLQEVKLSERVQLPPNQFKDIHVNISLNNVTTEDSLNIFVFDALDQLTPLARKQIFVRELVETPFQAEIGELYRMHNNNEDIHPRIMATQEDFDRIKASYHTNAYVKKWTDNVIASADTIVERAMKTDNQDQDGKYYIGYVFSEGERLLEMSRRVKDFMTILGMAYRLTNNEKYAEKAWRIMERAGKPNTDKPVAPLQFPDWHPVHYLDTAEMTAGFAIGYDWCYEYFTEEQRQYIVRSIKEYGLDLAKKAYGGESIPGGNWWVKTTNNWNVVCNGGMVMGAMVVADQYPDLAFLIIEKAVAGLKYMLPSFAPDGAWYEGPSYWHYTMQYMAKMVTTLEKSLGTDFGIMNAEGINKTGDFILHLDGPTGINNFHDAGGGHINSPELFWVSNVYGNDGLTAAKLYNMNQYGQSGGALDLLWYNTSIGPDEIRLEKDAYFRDAEVVTMRGSWGDQNTQWLSFHAGKANISHSHLDCGTFVLDSQGVRWAEDLGSDAYTLPDYFGNQRWNYYRLRTEGHNTLLINPDTSGGQDLDASTKIIRFEPNVANPFSVADLSSAYKQQANSVLRGFKMVDNRRGLIIRDEIDLKTNNNNIYWFMHTKASDISINGNTVRMTYNGKIMLLEFDANAESVSVSVVSAKPLPTSPNPSGQNQNSGYKKIQIKLTGRGKVNLTVKLRPVDSGSYSGLDTTPISQW